jgi:tetratricopeptide (TPR) repeat protein
MRSSIRLLAALAALASSVALHAQPQPAESEEEEEEAESPSSAAPAPPGKLPAQELTEPILYEFLLGEIARQYGNPGLAAQTYIDLAKRTRDPRIARRAVEMANLARSPALALEAARVWNAADPESTPARRALVALLVAARKLDEAEPHIAKLLGTGSAAPGGFMQLAQLFAQNPDKRANLVVVQRLAKRHPKLPEAHFAVAQAAAAANDEALALKELGQAASIRPEWELAAMFESQLLRRRSFDAAAQRLSAYLENYPASREVRLHYARLLVSERRYPEAQAQFETLLSTHANDTEAIYGVGLLAMQAKDYATAEANLKRLLDLGYRDPNGVRYTLGQIAEEQKDWGRAIDWYATIQRGEHAIPARMRTANVLAKQGKLDEARAFLHAVSATETQRVQLLIAEAQLLREANRHKEAFELLGSALEKNPEQPDLLYDHALTAEKIDRMDVLEANLRKVIAVKPDHAHAYNALGYSLADRNERLPEARKLVERALELAPEDYYIIDSMGWVLYRMGDLKGAAEQLRRAWLGRPDGEIGAHLGEVLWVMGEREEAERIWGEALKTSPENETLQKTIRRLKK